MDYNIFMDSYKRKPATEVAEMAKQLLASRRAAISDGWLLIPKTVLTDDFSAKLKQSGIESESLMTATAIKVSDVNYAVGYQIIKQEIPKRIKGKDKDSVRPAKEADGPKSKWCTRIRPVGTADSWEDIFGGFAEEKPKKSPPETGWWKHGPISDVVSQMVTAAPPLPVDDPRIALMEEAADLRTTHNSEAESFLNDPKKAAEYRIDVEKLRGAVKMVKDMCAEYGVPVPKLCVHIGGFCATYDYQRINISSTHLEKLSPRALRGELAHELGHVLMNHTLQRPENLPLHMRNHSANFAFALQMEAEADYMGAVLSKDPLALAQYMIEFARMEIATAKKSQDRFSTPSQRVAERVDIYNNGASGDDHPRTRLRIHRFREMAEERKRAEATIAV